MAAIASVIPNVVQCGEPAPIIDVYGDGFINPTTLITVDGVNYPTTFIDSTHLRTIGIDPSLRTQPGYVKVGVVGDTAIRYFHFTPYAVQNPTGKSNWYDVTP